MRTGILLAVLTISVAINLWQWRSRSAAGEGAAAESVAPQVTAAVASSISSRASAPTCAPGTASSQEQVACNAELTQLRARLQVLEREHKEHLPMNKRFEEGAADPSSKRRIEAKLQRILSADGGSNSWTVECRDQVCKVDVFAESQEEWSQQMRELQHDPELRPLVSSFGTYSGTPAKDLVTGKSGLEIPNYLAVRTDGDANAMAALYALRDQLKATGAVKDCTHGYAERGLAQFLLSLEPDTTFRAEVQGAGLGQTSAGSCIRSRLQEIAASAQMPAPDSEVQLTLYVESPPSTP